jgi:MraZ protein
MFRGIKSVNMDAKGRLVLPARHRETVLSNGTGHLVITIDTREKCLLLYLRSEWELVQKRLIELSNINSSARLLQRLLIGHATDVEMDASGRVLVAPMLREFAGLSKKLVLLGQGNKVEIWGDEHWQLRLTAWLEERASDGLDDNDQFVGLSV